MALCYYDGTLIFNEAKNLKVTVCGFKSNWLYPTSRPKGSEEARRNILPLLVDTNTWLLQESDSVESEFESSIYESGLVELGNGYLFNKYRAEVTIGFDI